MEFQSLGSDVELIYSAAEEIKRSYPHLRDIDIDYQTEKDGAVLSTIALKMDNRRFVAKKVDQSLEKSLYKATKALVKQLEKFKGKRKRYFMKNLSVA